MAWWTPVALMVAAEAWAADVQMFLSKDRAEVGEQILLRVNTIDGRPTDPPVIAAPKEVSVTFRSQEDRMTNVNGSITRVASHTYVVMPMAEGTFELGPATIVTSFGTLKADPVRLQVTPSTKGDDPIRLVAGFGTDTLWEGQTAVFRADILADEGQRYLAGPQFQVPSFDGFSAAPHGASKGWDDPVVDGHTDGSHMVVPLVATGRGPFILQPMRATIAHDLGIVDRWGRPRAKAEQLFSDVTRVQVKPLPPGPPNATGLVGEFRFKANVSKLKAKVGDSIELRIDGRGSGGFAGVDLPDLALDGFQVYPGDPSFSGDVDRRTGEYQSRGTYRYSLAPTRPGTFTPEPITVATFSPQKGDWVESTIRFPTLTITGEAQEGELESFGQEPPPEAGAPTGPVIRPAMAAPWIASSPPLALGLPLVAGLGALPGLWVGSLVVGAAWRRRQEARAATREAAPVRGRMLLAQLPADRQERLTALDGALRHALSEHTKVPVASLDRDAAIDGLADASLAAQLRAAFSGLDQARFAGMSEPPTIEQDVRALVAALEGP